MLDSLFDPYARKARLYPALLALVPAFVFAAVNFSVLELDWSHALAAAFLAAILFFLADFSRHMGKRKEQKLLIKWEGFPSARFLRHSDTNLNPTQTNRYHELINSILPDIEMPSRSLEAENPKQADAIYETVCNALLSRTRNQKTYALLFKENVNYGFRRNMLGLKPIAIMICGFVIALELTTSVSDFSSLHQLNAESLMTAAGSCLAAGIWTFSVTEQFVESAANQFARQLLQTLEGFE